MTETDRRRCRGTKTNGDRCGAPGRLVDPDTGFCPSHGPGASEEMARRGRKGGYVSTSPRRGHGLNLPPLVDLDAAQIWAEEVARAVADDRLSASRGNTLNKVLKTWLSAHENAEADRAIREAHEGEVFGPRA